MCSKSLCTAHIFIIHPFTVPSQAPLRVTTRLLKVRSWAGEMALWVKALSVQSLGPEFDPQSSRKRRRRKLSPQSSPLAGAHTPCTRTQNSNKIKFKSKISCMAPLRPLAPPLLRLYGALRLSVRVSPGTILTQLCDYLVECQCKDTRVWLRPLWHSALFTWAISHAVCFVLQAAYVLSKYQYFVCPVEYRSDVNSFVTECEPSELFQLQSYSLPPFLKAVLRRVRANGQLT